MARKKVRTVEAAVPKGHLRRANRWWNRGGKDFDFKQLFAAYAKAKGLNIFRTPETEQEKELMSLFPVDEAERITQIIGKLHNARPLYVASFSRERELQAEFRSPRYNSFHISAEDVMLALIFLRLHESDDLHVSVSENPEEIEGRRALDLSLKCRGDAIRFLEEVLHYVESEAERCRLPESITPYFAIVPRPHLNLSMLGDRISFSM